MVEGKRDRHFDNEPQRRTITALETFVKNLAGEPTPGIQISPLYPPAETAMSRYRQGDRVIDVSFTTLRRPITDDLVTLTEIKTQDRKPIITTGNNREYPYTKLGIKTEEGESQVTLGISSEGHVDTYEIRMRSLEESAVPKIPGSEADIQDMLRVTQDITPDDKIDKYGLTQAERELELADIEAIKQQLRTLAIVSRETKIKYPIFVTNEGKTVDVRIYKKQAKGDTRVANKDIFPRAKTLYQRARDRVTLFRGKTEGFSIEVTDVPVTDSDGNKITETQKYRAQNFEEDRGLSLYTNITSYIRPPYEEPYTIGPKVIAKSLDEMTLDETVFDPSEVANVYVSPQGRQDLLTLVQSLNTTMIQDRYQSR